MVLQVFGASGKTGRLVVKSLVEQGKTVVAAVRNKDRAQKVFQEIGLNEGRQKSKSSGILFIDGGIDVTNGDTLTEGLFAGVQQVVMCLGPVFGRTSDGTMGYIDNLTSERVDAMGTENVVVAAKIYLKKQTKLVKTVLPMQSEDDLQVWERLDDVIMGGNSSSALNPWNNGKGAIWKGKLIVEGGGFCGARTKPAPLDLSEYDGIALRVKGGGKTLKLNVKTTDFSEPEDTFQATIETNEGEEFTDIFLPWHEFVPVKRAKTLPNGPALDPRSIRQFGIVYSRFSYNGFANDSYTPGEFEVIIEDGIKAARLPRPQLVMVSSAGVERNAVIGDDEEKRKADIPIVQLNPGGVLNHKYTGENVIRESGLPYLIVRPTGMSDDAGAEGPALLEASQGDRISGKVARSDIADLISFGLNSSNALSKTFEVRRSEASDAQNKEMSSSDMLQLFLGLVQDSRRTKIGVPPFPAPASPPAPPSEERKNEILNDPRVKATVERGAGGRVRKIEEEETEVTSTADGRDSVAGKQSISDATEAEGKSKSLIKTVQKDVSPGSGDDVPDNVKEAREWIRKWRVKNLEKALPQDASSKAL